MPCGSKDPAGQVADAGRIGLAALGGILIVSSAGLSAPVLSLLIVLCLAFVAILPLGLGWLTKCYRSP